MILVFGGTTEGRIAVELLDQAGKGYFYSTKRDEQDISLHHGTRLSGVMDRDTMIHFCKKHQIALIIDAAHPFAEVLHQTIAEVSKLLALPVIRVERLYTTTKDLQANISWARSYQEVISLLEQSSYQRLLFLTGVQTIERFQPIWKCSDRECFFRILDRDSSRMIAQKAGFPKEQLLYYPLETDSDEHTLLKELNPDAIILKESGSSGGFYKKISAALDLNIPVIAIKRPSTPESFIKVNGPHGLRRAIEKLLPSFYDLHSGLTTGSCATAASVAAINYFLGNQPSEVTITLPNQESIRVPVSYKESWAVVYKDSGDDPDVTNGIEIQAQVIKEDHKQGLYYEVSIEAVQGIGIVSLPGLGIAIGEAAINETPRKMIIENSLRTLKLNGAPYGSYTIRLAIPQGEELAKRTFNPRIGILGGISIIGTSGIVQPFSLEAFIASIEKTMEVAKASGSKAVVINSGAKSEKYLKSYYHTLPAQAFIHYGNFIGETLKIAHKLQIPHLILGLMIGKAVKLAEGFLDTHSKQNVMNRDFIASIALKAGCPDATADKILKINMARELWNVIAKEDLQAFTDLLIEACYSQCKPLLPNGELTIHLITDEGEVLSISQNE